MFESQTLRQDIESSLMDALKGVDALSRTDDIESPSDDYCKRLKTAIRNALDIL